MRKTLREIDLLLVHRESHRKYLIKADPLIMDDSLYRQSFGDKLGKYVNFGLIIMDNSQYGRDSCGTEVSI